MARREFPRYLELARPARHTIVVGDIHGCWAEFKALLAAVDFGSDDLLLGVGDFLDRGPRSWRVARFFRDTPNAATVFGNHEYRMVAAIRGQEEGSWSHRHALSRLPRKRWTRWADWLATLPAIIRTPDVVVAHGRLDPERALDRQKPRYVAACAHADTWIDLDDEGVPLWIRRLPGDDAICIGHIRYDRVDLVPERLYALDTAACRGGELTALVLPDHALVAVDVAVNHEQQSRQQWTRRHRAD